MTVFMEGLLTGVARTEVFRVHPSTFEEAVSIAQNAEHNFKSARLGWNGYNLSCARATSESTSAYCKPEPMDLSHAEDEGESKFMLQSNDRKWDAVICAEALNTCVPLVPCGSNNRLL